MRKQVSITAGAVALAAIITCTLAAAAVARSLDNGEAAINGLSPKQAMVGQLVTVSGMNLDGTTGVSFGKVPSRSVRVDPGGSWVRAVVPAGVPTGSVFVTLDNGGNPASVGPLHILPGSVPAAANPSPSAAKTSPGTLAPAIRLAPRIQTFSPTSGRVGTAVRITGANLGHALWLNFGGVRAHMTMSSRSVIIAVVPKKAHSGKIAVHTSGGTGLSAGRFVVLRTAAA
jgi:hypothetical protein